MNVETWFHQDDPRAWKERGYPGFQSPKTNSTLKGLYNGNVSTGCATLTGLDDLSGHGTRGSRYRVNPGLNDGTLTGFKTGPGIFPILNTFSRHTQLVVTN